MNKTDKLQLNELNDNEWKISQQSTKYKSIVEQGNALMTLQSIIYLIQQIERDYKFKIIVEMIKND